MKSRKVLSPDVVLKDSSRLVPLKQKSKPSKIQEIPGWRLATSHSPRNLGIEPSKLFKVKHKKDFYTTQMFATDERLPIILQPKLKKSEKSKSFGFANEIRMIGGKKNSLAEMRLSPVSGCTVNGDGKLSLCESSGRSETVNSCVDMKIMSGKSDLRLSGKSSGLKNGSFGLKPQVSALGNLDEHMLLVDKKENQGSEDFDIKFEDPDRKNEDSYRKNENLSRGSVSRNSLKPGPNSSPILMSPLNTKKNKKNFKKSLLFTNLNTLQPGSMHSDPLYPCVSLKYPNEKLQSSSEENLLERRKSEVVGNLQSLLSFTTPHKSLKISSSYKKNEKTPESESLSLEDEKENPDKEILSLRKELEKNQNRPSRVLFAEENTKKESIQTKSGKNPTHKNSVLKKTPDKGLKKPIMKTYTSIGLNLPQNEKRRSSAIPDFEEAASQDGVQSVKPDSDLTPSKSVKETFSTTTSPLQYLSKDLNKELKSQSSLKIKQLYAEGLEKPYLLSHIPDSSKARLSFTSPKKKLKSSKSLKKPPKKTQTSNLDTIDEPIVRKRKKINSEKKPYDKNTEKRKDTLGDLESYAENEELVFIKITEAEEPNQFLYNKKTENFENNNDEIAVERGEQHYLALPSLNLMRLSSDSSSKMSNRSRASHDASKHAQKNPEFAKKRLSKKDIYKLEVPSLESAKKSPQVTDRRKKSSGLVSEEISSECSNESVHSNFSRTSNSRKVSLDKKFLTKNSIPILRKRTQRNPATIKSFDSEVDKNLSKLDPVTNFIFNFSFSLLNTLKSLVRTNLLRNSKHITSPIPSRLFKPQLSEKDSLLSGKLRVNKSHQKDSKLSISASPQLQTVSASPQPQIIRASPQSLIKRRSIKQSSVSPSYSPKDLNLKSARSIRVKKEKSKSQRPSHLKVTEELSDDSSDLESYESEISSEELSLRNHIKQSLMYELAQHDLTLQIAKQILGTKDEEKNLEESFSQSEGKKEALEEECGNLNEEIEEFSSKISNFTAKFAFGNEIDFKTMQKYQMMFSFKELEEGCFEIDMENLMRESAKRHFLEKKALHDEMITRADDELQLLPDGNMTEEELYRARMQKVKIVGEKLRKRREKLSVLNGERTDLQSSFGIKKGVGKTDSASFGESLEERVYYRLKEAAVLLKKN